jgi:hypothetical protein
MTTTKQPPALATWLLKHFGCGPNNDSVLGDLAEQYQNKSRMWYWRQVLKGIPVSVVTAALGHKVIAARAIVAGCIAWFAFLVLYPRLVFGFSPQPGPTFDLYHYLAHPLFAWAALWIPVLFSVSSPGDSWVLQLWIQVALPLSAWAVCGWIVTRVDTGRAHRDLAPLFAGFILLLNLLFVIPGLTGFLAEFRGRPFGPNGAVLSIHAASLIALTVANMAISVFGILLGGSVRRADSADRSVLVPRG